MKQKAEPLARASMRLPADLWKQAQHAAIDQGITIQELVSRALAAYLKKAGAR